MNDENKQPSSKKVDVSAIYPEVTHHPEPLPLPQATEKDTQQFSNSIFTGQLITFFSNVAFITLIGIVLGIVFNENLVSKNGEYFGNFSDLFSYIFALPIPLIVFSVIAIAARNPLYFFTPLIAFSLAQYIQYTHLTKLIADYIPISYPQDMFTHSTTGLATVTLSYLITYLFLRAAWLVAKNISGKNREEKTIVISTLVTISLSAGLFVGMFFIATPLYAAQQRERRSIRIPNTESIYGNLQRNYTLSFNNPDQSSPYQYVDSATVYTKELKQWWKKDITTNCGSTPRLSSSSALTGNYTTKYIKNKIPYRVASIKNNGSQPPTPEHAQTTYIYCFIVDNHTYRIERIVNDRRGATTLQKKYPIEVTIEAIANSKTYLLECTTDELLLLSTGYYSSTDSTIKTLPDYCFPSDNKQNKQLSERRQELLR